MLQCIHHYPITKPYCGPAALDEKILLTLGRKASVVQRGFVCAEMGSDTVATKVVVLHVVESVVHP
jgi:hypothetical protein